MFYFLSPFISLSLLPPSNATLFYQHMYSKYHSTSYPSTSHLTVSLCPLSCWPQLKPTSHRTFLLFHPVSNSLGTTESIYMPAMVHTSSSSSKVMFLSVGLKPKASAGVLQRTTVEARAELQRWHFPHLSPWPAHHSHPAPQPLGICKDKDWTSLDATLHKGLIAGKTLASVIKAVI